MYEQTMGRLVFEDGYFDFGAKAFVREPIEHMSRVPRPFPKRIERDVREVRKRLLEPILGDIEGAFMNYLARGLAGCVDDKSWAAGLGERNSGKSVLCTLAELAFGRDIVCTVNSESFLCSKKQRRGRGEGSWFRPDAGRVGSVGSAMHGWIYNWMDGSIFEWKDGWMDLYLNGRMANASVSIH